MSLRELKFSNQVQEEQVKSVYHKNFNYVVTERFYFQQQWLHNAYLRFKDFDKYLILIYLIQKTFTHYTDLMVIISEETIYAQDTFEIDKINLIEISEELGIPKETVRRKINELSNDGVVERSGKRIILKVNAFHKQRPVKTVKTLSSFLAICSGHPFRPF